MIDQKLIIKAKNEVVKENNISLHPFNINFITDEYISWLNDPEVNRYLECRFVKNNYNSLSIYISDITRSNNTIMYAIHYKKKYIGTIKLGPIDLNHMTSHIGFLIGNSSYHKLGIASRSINLISSIALKLKIKKLYAGCYESNYASVRCLNKTNFNLLAFDKYAIFNSDGIREGRYLFEKILFEYD